MCMGTGQSHFFWNWVRKYQRITNDEVHIHDFKLPIVVSCNTNTESITSMTTLNTESAQNFTSMTTLDRPASRSPVSTVVPVVLTILALLGLAVCIVCALIFIRVRIQRKMFLRRAEVWNYCVCVYIQTISNLFVAEILCFFTDLHPIYFLAVSAVIKLPSSIVYVFKWWQDEVRVL